ncbi:hypothetical protein ACLKA6_004710 [Drosophila palustris]
MLLPRDNTLCALWALLLLITLVNRSAAFGVARGLRRRRHPGPTLDTDDYYSYDGMLKYLDDLTQAYSERLKLSDVGTTHENRTLRSITITNGDGRTGKKVIFVVATEHAREWLTPVAALYTVEQLVVNFERNAHLLQDYDWIVMPMVNPDGYMYSRSIDNMWRNNRSPNGNNCFGTNINRNYDIDWGKGYPEITDPCHEHYAGSKPFSESESRAVRDIIVDLVNTKRAVMFLSLHSRHRSVFYPWVYKSDLADNVKQLREIAKIGAQTMENASGKNFTYEQTGGYDPFGGTSLDYAYNTGFPLSFALELSGERGNMVFDFWPPTSLLKDLADDSWQGIRAMAEKAIEYYPKNTAFLFHLGNGKRRAAVANLPGPFCWPVFGALQLMFKLNPKSFIEVSAKQVDKHGELQRVWAFDRLMILSCDLEFNEQLLASQEHLVKHPVYKVLGQWLGNGLLLSDGKVWHQRRKIITPTFHFSILEQFVEVFDQQSNICIQRLEQKADGKTTFDVYPFICLAALDIIAETAMGTKVNAQMAESTPYANAVNECTARFAWRFMTIYLQSEFLFTLTRPHLKWRQTKLIRTMHEFTIKVIEQRRKTLEQEQQKQAEQLDKRTEEEDVGSKRRMALLDVLLQSSVDGRPLRNEEIREEVDTFMFEGHDTTASAISFCLWQISRHAEVQEKLLEEILRVLGADHSRPITIRDLAELKYTECVIKESLRMHPPVPIVGRKLQTDFKYTHSRLGDGVIPAGTEIIVGIIGQQNGEANFPEHKLFKPERHENGERVSNFAFLPFSAGPRNCIGQKFAQLEMKMMLAKIVRAYELLPLGETISPVVNIVLRSDTGFQLGMRKRSSSTVDT